MRYLLDTSALLAHFRQEAGWDIVQALFETDDAELIIASVSLTEFGRRLRELGATEIEIEEVFVAYQLLFSDVVSIDTLVAKTAFVIGCRTPQRLPLIDALIAAVAQTRTAILVHRDDHMRAIPPELLGQQELPPHSHG
ncbi:MAG: PIN domain-containing protein [Caldilineaceae bacterium]|nr:PIN domain-containing protein [Caldilineaceae bacterium]HRJ43087.1 PIN domain-containing protein [Caldilineaceae bacterium]